MLFGKEWLRENPLGYTRVRFRWESVFAESWGVWPWLVTDVASRSLSQEGREVTCQGSCGQVVSESRSYTKSSDS